MKVGHELDFASGYFMVLPRNWKDPSSTEKPYLFISSKCPKDIKEKLLKEWEIVKAETIKRHEEGHFSSSDYF